LYLTLESSDAKAVGEWFYATWLYDIALGTIFGSLLGVGFRHLMKFCERRDLIDRKSIVAQYVSLAILSIGATTLLGSDDLLAAFACGCGFAWDGESISPFFAKLVLTPLPCF
jgi:sodium/hydrogen antiporter